MQLGDLATWETISLNIASYAGQEVILSFDFDSLDEQSNQYEGWYVDTVQLRSVGPVTYDVPATTADASRVVALSYSGESILGVGKVGSV